MATSCQARCAHLWAQCQVHSGCTGTDCLTTNTSAVPPYRTQHSTSSGRQGGTAQGAPRLVQGYMLHLGRGSPAGRGGPLRTPGQGCFPATLFLTKTGPSGQIFTSLWAKMQTPSLIKQNTTGTIFTVKQLWSWGWMQMGRASHVPSGGLSLLGCKAGQVPPPPRLF